MPYYEDPCLQQNQCQDTVVLSQYSTIIRISTGWAVPNVSELVTLKVSALADILIGSYIWNPNYGSYVVESYDPEEQKIKVRLAPRNDVEGGTVIPSCTKFVVTTSVNPEYFDLLIEAVGALQLQVAQLTDSVAEAFDQIAEIYDFIQMTFAEFTPSIHINTGTLAVNSATTEYAFSGETCFIRFNIDISISVTNALYVEFDLPFQAASGDLQYITGDAIQGGSGGVGTPVYYRITNGTTKCRIYKADTSTFAQTSWGFALNFLYRRVIP